MHTIKIEPRNRIFVAFFFSLYVWRICFRWMEYLRALSTPFFLVQATRITVKFYIESNRRSTLKNFNICFRFRCILASIAYGMRHEAWGMRHKKWFITSSFFEKRMKNENRIFSFTWILNRYRYRYRNRTERKWNSTVDEFLEMFLSMACYCWMLEMVWCLRWELWKYHCILCGFWRIAVDRQVYVR